MRIDPKDYRFDANERHALVNALQDREDKLIKQLATRKTGRDSILSELAYVQDCICRLTQDTAMYKYTGQAGSDNEATRLGYTQRAMLEDGHSTLFVLVKPGIDYSCEFQAFDTDEQEWVTIYGWACDTQLWDEDELAQAIELGER